MDRSMISLRTMFMLLGMMIFAGWAVVNVGGWANFITLPLSVFAGLVAAELDRREGRLS
jgi:hypothetical protein